MPSTPFDSAIYRDLFRNEEAGRLFDDAAEIRSMLAVEGELARVQGRRGMIPEAAGEAMHRASGKISVDPAALAPETGRNAVSVPAPVEAFREAMRDPEHSRFAHWGTTSQDIMETGPVLRLREFLAPANPGSPPPSPRSAISRSPMPNCRLRREPADRQRP